MQALLESNAVQFHNRCIGKMGVMRRVLELVRSIMGEDTYIASGIIPMEAAAGMLDAVRMAGDISNFWGHIRRNALQTAASFWMQDRLWNNDPDFLIVRSTTTSSDKYFKRPLQQMPYNSSLSWMDGRMANEEELKTWATVLLLSGGDMVLSDNLSTLNGRGREIIRKTIEARLDVPAVPVDLFDCPGAPPTTWIGGKDGSKVLALFNWSEGLCEFVLGRQIPGITRAKALDFWNGEELIVDPSTCIRLNPHSVKLLVIESAF
jgi:alpha-galactosidase